MSNVATKEETDLHPDMAANIDDIDEHVSQWSNDASVTGTMTPQEDADVETTSSDDNNYDLARDEVYETDLLGEDSDLDQDKATSEDDMNLPLDENSPDRGGGESTG